ncbi:tetratricopeptide repeat protein [Antarcticirhabdus aurantiaca]|uniref:Tetratricopeptide repeat protein n=1 Tax=Antarcticirhabdus aurantiaca TaxID=2606717 RepID=A0ACD4NMW1_9HYPH|nr:tetratricopeptide repeat protein [Antarcticirhabdus aurantiaca]WAJ28218.1 tetratricopeptide repeat protein [Jeongeuplla avenae]
MRRAGLAAALLAALIAAPAAAVDTPPSDDLPDLSAIRAKIYSDDFEGAAADLSALSKTVRHADIYNLLGFATRKLGRFEEAGRWYREALYYDPQHRPALEYQGELFLQTGDVEAARGNLVQLEFLCPEGCEELDTLRAAIASRAGS